jgi:YfiH family protein
MPMPERQPPVWPADWLRPGFSHPRVGAVMTTRAGGVSRVPYDSLNLRDEVGDDPRAVEINRARLHAAIGRPSLLMQQVHGTVVCRLDEVAHGDRPVADACVTATSARACEIQVADCLPVLFAHRGGRSVGAAHAGWRGLAGGVLEATLAAVCALAGADPGDIECWLGPCIGPDRFEVGPDVIAAFGADVAKPGPRWRPGVPGKWLADLSGLARDRLSAAGVRVQRGNDGTAFWCTLSDPGRYFSYRHNARAGRMAALVWLA